MAKLSNDWWHAFRGSFETKEDVIEFIYERLDTSDFEDSYIVMGRYGEPNECFKQSAEDKRILLYDFMMELISEYSMPDDFQCIWSKELKTSLGSGVNGNTDKIRVEKLFTYSI